MEFIPGLAALAAFIIAVAMIMRGQSPIISLLILAILWPFIGGASISDVTTGVVQKGADTYAASVVTILFGAWFGQVIVQTGIAESLVRSVVELAGDRPLVVLLAIDLVVAVLFTSLYGVGAAIGVGVIVLPILMSMGVPAWLAGTSFPLAMTVSYSINVVQFNTLAPLFMKDPSYARYFPWLATLGMVFLACTLLMGVFHMRRFSVAKQSSVSVAAAATRPSVPWYAYVTPLVPIIMIIVFKWAVIPTFLLAIVFALATTWRSRTFQGAIDLFHKTFYDAFPDIATIAAVFVICGMLIVGGQTPQVQAILKPVVSPIVPTDRLSLVLLMAVFAPLMLYRGPLNVIGTGAALLTMVVSAGTFSGELLYPFWMCTMWMLGQDPTSSQCLWSMGYTKINQRQFLSTGLPFQWLAAIVAATIAYFVLPL